LQHAEGGYTTNLPLEIALQENFLAGRNHQFPRDVHQHGTSTCDGKPLVYCSAGTHTWVQKAIDLFGLGTEAIRFYVPYVTL